MAGTMTHFKFMKDLALKINFQSDNNLFLVAGQGHDLLYFIKLKDLKSFALRIKIANAIASKKFKKIVIKWQQVILDSKNKNLEILLYGYIAHHILDSYIHPWLNKKCNCYFDRSDQKTWKNNGKHEFLESTLDMIVMNPYKFKIPRVNIDDETKCLINDIFYSVYYKENIGTLFAQGIKNINGFINLYRKDRLGIKKIGYKLLDKLSSASHQKYEFLAYKYSHKTLEKIELAYWKDFWKLYNTALYESQKLILEIQKNLKQKKVTDNIPSISAT